jgi:PAS domain S-box-containing protein
LADRATESRAWQSIREFETSSLETSLARSERRRSPTNAEANLRLATEAGRMGVWELDLRTGELTASALYKRNLGLPPETPLRCAQLDDITHPEDRQRRRDAVARAIAEGTEYDIEYRVLHPGGAIAWLHVRAQVTCGADGTALRMAGISLDITERRRAELRLELSEESLRLAADAAEVGTWDLDLTTDVLTWSNRTKAMFGISPHVPCSMADFYAGLHPEDRDAVSEAFARAIDPASRTHYDVEYRTVGREDGVVRWVAAKGKGLFHGGRCTRALGTAIDITERKQAAIRQSFLLDLMDRLRNLSDPTAIMQTALRSLGSHLGACRVGYGQVQQDQETVLLETCHDDGMQPLSGLARLDLLGPHQLARQREGHTVTVADLAAGSPADIALWQAVAARAYVSVPLMRGGTLRATLFVNHRDPHDWSAGEIELIENVAARVWDALERARAESALRLLNAALEEQVATRTRELARTWRLAPVIMVVGGQDGKLLDVNAAWTRILGWTREQTVGRDVLSFVAEEDQAVGLAGMERLARGLPVSDYHIRFLTSSGERRSIAWTTMPDGGLLYGYGRDVTDQRIAEERLLQAQKMEAVGQLTGGLAHDFNNLLTAIMGGLELVGGRLSQGRTEGLERFIGVAQTAAERAAALTQRLLAFSRRQTLDPKPTDINGLVRGMEELVRRTVGPELTVNASVAPVAWTTLVDPNQLENALLNLCINARDAMPDGGTLTIATAEHRVGDEDARELDLPPGNYVSLSVTDTGTGMTPDVMRRAFDPFFTTKPLGAGTGLGLSMIYGFARQSGGQVRIRSEVGAGTEVRIILPRHAGEAAAHAAADPMGRVTEAAPVAGKTGRGSVLVVDDEAAVRLMVCEVLADLGYRPIEAEDGAAGLRVLDSDLPLNLLVTDVGLPGGMNGRQLAGLARRLRPDLPVLFITGFAETAACGCFDLECGMQVMTKPFALDALAARIGEMLQKEGDVLFR